MAVTLQAELEKHQAEEQELITRRNNLVKAGIILPESEGAAAAGAHGAFAPGFNPKDTAETFMRKITAN